MVDASELPQESDRSAGRAPAAGARGRISLAALLAALLVPVAPAQEALRGAPGAGPASSAPQQAAPAGGPDVVAAVEDPRRRTARRLLRLRQGGVLRAPARWAEDHWEFQRDGSWAPLPAGAVESDLLESEALAQSRKRRAAVPRRDAAGLAAHVAWQLDTGLNTEAFNLASEVLELDPDQPELLARLRAGDLPVSLPRVDVPEAELPAARARLVAFGAGAPRSLQELAIQQLRPLAADAAQAAELRAELAALLASHSAGARAFAALALRRLVPPGAVSQPEVEELLRRSLRDVSPEVRMAASLALRDARQEGLILPALLALESPSRALRTHAAESLGVLGHTAAVPALVERLLTLPAAGGSGGYRAPRSHVTVGSQIAYVAGFDVDVTQNAAVGDPEIGTLQVGATLDVGVLGVSTGDGHAAESKALRTALTKLTGADPGSRTSSWKSWWEQNGDRWTAPGATSGSGHGAPPADAR